MRKRLREACAGGNRERASCRRRVTSMFAEGGASEGCAVVGGDSENRKRPLDPPDAPCETVCGEDDAMCSGEELCEGDSRQWSDRVPEDERVFRAEREEDARLKTPVSGTDGGGDVVRLRPDDDGRHVEAVSFPLQDGGGYPAFSMRARFRFSDVAPVEWRDACDAKKLTAALHRQAINNRLNLELADRYVSRCGDRASTCRSLSTVAATRRGASRTRSRRTRQSRVREIRARTPGPQRGSLT